MFEIYLSDLTPEAQQRFKEFLGFDPAEENYDLFPIAVMEA